MSFRFQLTYHLLREALPPPLPLIQLELFDNTLWNYLICLVLAYCCLFAWGVHSVRAGWAASTRDRAGHEEAL